MYHFLGGWTPLTMFVSVASRKGAFKTKNYQNISKIYHEPDYHFPRIHCACCPGTMSPSASFLRHSSLAAAGLRAPLSRVLEEAIFRRRSTTHFVLLSDYVYIRGRP